MRVVMDEKVVAPIAIKIWGIKSERRIRGVLQGFMYKGWHLFTDVERVVSNSHTWHVDGGKGGKYKNFGPIKNRRDLRAILGLVKTIADADPNKRVICAVKFGKEQAEYDAIALRYNRKKVLVEKAKLKTESGLSRVVYAITATEG